MPTYVYACDSCGKQFEKFQSFKDEPLTVCLCGQEGKVRRVIQPAGIVFKGSGWYINDSRGSSSSTVGSEPVKAETTPATTEAASTSEKSDSSAPATSSSDE
ncbi:regulatory protein, FmdB family [Oscillochloris trichoides DG-6]|uniref:Regulatory protein, FmdB family n=1 Tax=Oscillochloris trichoides DG-6 TaxID=765420 RepID=E1ICB5_9CHLR|nr:FmdB family zinc ribbon protein [Oscillochloris trichoides]EFO81169.1 regulatory protein, FmdB family [Oscillochloris trichoides DG-6]